MGRSGRLFLLLRPYALLFVANLVATFVASVMDGATFVLLIPFLRTVFGHDPLNVAGGSAVERLLAVVVGPLFAAGAPGAAPRNVVQGAADRKSTRLNSSHGYNSYAVFCFEKKKDHQVARHLR